MDTSTIIGTIADPLTPWYASATESPGGGALSDLVTGVTPAADRITALEHRWGLTGESPHIVQWDALAATAAVDVAAARMYEPHVDALGLLAEAGAGPPTPGTTWGVYAAEVPGRVVTATEAADGSLTLNGEKAWCSLAAHLSHAIVIADLGSAKQACAVSLTDERVHPSDEAWPSLGLSEIPSGSVAFADAPATAVGPGDWYLRRPSFAWGGIRVAACWYGGALGLARSAAAAHLRRPQPSPLGNLLLGRLDAQITTARSVLAHAAAVADGPAGHTRDQAWTLALRVRNIVYRAAGRIQELSRELAGPATLTGNPSFAKADADLTVYLSQHHGPRDESGLGDAIVDDPAAR